MSAAGRPSYQALAAGWWTWVLKVRATQTLTSGRYIVAVRGRTGRPPVAGQVASDGGRIFLVEDLRDHLVGQVEAPRFAAADQRELDPLLLPGGRRSRRRGVRHAHGRPF